MQPALRSLPNRTTHPTDPPDPPLTTPAASAVSDALDQHRFSTDGCPHDVAETVATSVESG
jgi:hypothetical protein